MSKHFGRALLWLTGAEILYNLSGYIIHSALGRILGPEEYGRYGLVVTLTTMIIVLVGNGVPTTMSKYLSSVFEKHPEKIYGIRLSAQRLQIMLMGGVTVVFFLLAPVFASLLHDETLTPLFQLSALIIPTFAAASFNLYYFIGLHFFRVQAILKSIRALARILLIVGLAAFFGVKGAVTGNIVAPLLVFIVGLTIEAFLTKKYFPSAEKSTSEAFSQKVLLQYAWPLTLFLLFYELVLTLDLYLVKSLLQSDYLTGIYNATITVGRIPYYLFYALALLMLPAISKTTADNDTGETKKIVTRSYRLLILLLLPMVTFLVLYAQPLLHFFYGSRFLEATEPLQIFAIGVGFLTVFYVLAFALNGAGLVKIPMILASIGFVASFILNILFIPRYELIGAAGATTVTSLFLMLGILLYTRAHFQIIFPWRTLFFTFAAIVFVAPLSVFLPAGPFSFLFSGVLLFSLYLALLKLTGELKNEDITPLFRLMRR